MWPAYRSIIVFLRIEAFMKRHGQGGALLVVLALLNPGLLRAQATLSFRGGASLATFGGDDSSGPATTIDSRTGVSVGAALTFGLGANGGIQVGGAFVQKGFTQESFTFGEEGFSPTSLTCSAGPLSSDPLSSDPRSADPRSAGLRSADVRSADVRSADVRSADVPRSAPLLRSRVLMAGPRQTRRQD